MKAPAAMINAIRNVQPSERLMAARVGEAAYRRAFARLEAFGDFPSTQNREMAAEAAAAEIAFRFA